MLGPDAGLLRAAEVGGHDGSGAAVEGERRDRHALVAQRHEFLQTGGLLRGEEVQRARRSAGGCQSAKDLRGVSVRACLP